MKLPIHAQEYFEEHPELADRIAKLEHTRNLRLFHKVKKDPNEINFYSWLSEMRFGLYLDSISSELRYDQKIDDKKPDWTSIINSQKILFEVLRINPDEESVKRQIELNREVKNFRKQNPGVGVFIQSGVKVMSSKYLYGAQSKLQNKEATYRDIIVKYKIPFIICIAATLDTFLDSLDVFDFLIGHHKRGFFYTDVHFQTIVTGVLLRTYYNEFVYFPNEMATNKLNEANEVLFKAILYKE